MNKEIMQVILDIWEEFKIENPHWRKGQALFNAIYYVAPEIADEIRGTSYDPFYCDELIDDCLNQIKNGT